jgi:hypothetical protein
MQRCSRFDGLQVYHVMRDGGNGLDNAQVLCRRCYELMDRPKAEGPEPQPFKEEVVRKALELAGYRCQCQSSGGCH